MDLNRFRKAQDIYFEAVEIRDLAERQLFLSKRCENDDALREEVESLLSTAEHSHNLLETGGALSHLKSIGDWQNIWADRQLGNWKLEGFLGRGGMGTVFSANRADEAFEQHVAVKVLTHYIFDTEGLQRFERERRILARLDHPLIARLIDGGLSDDGVPYLVMEKIDGIPINEWCSNNNLSVNEILELFLKVCSAVQHAHARLILHRDIKPSNVLVTPEGHPKLLDFGVARALSTSEEMDLTSAGQAPFTPEYAAPEQFTGGDLSAATDVYQLGVMLYRLLTGELPYQNRSNKIGVLMKEVMESTPLPPSQSVSATSSSTKHIASDLDAIVLMALRKEPERRYASVSELADDIDAFIRGRPVRAHGDGSAYRLRKFFCRHKTAVALSLLVFLSVAGGSIFTTRASWRAQRKANRALLEAEKAVAINQFLQQMLASADPLRMGSDVSIRHALDRAAESIDTSFASQPDIRVGIWSTIGQTYVNLGAIPESKPYLDSALAGYARLGKLYSQEAFPAHTAFIDGLFTDSRFQEIRSSISRTIDGYANESGNQTLQSFFYLLQMH